MSAGALGLPSSNRGVSETERIGVVIDWLASAFDLISVLDVYGMVDDRKAVLDDLDGFGAMLSEEFKTVGGRDFLALDQLLEFNGHFQHGKTSADVVGGDADMRGDLLEVPAEAFKATVHDSALKHRQRCTIVAGDDQ